MSPRSRCATIAGLLAFGLAAAEPPSESGTDPWRRQVEASLRDAEYAVTFQEHASIPGHPGGLHAANRAQDLRVYFTPAGIDLARRTEGEASWALHLAWRDAFDAAAASPHASGRSVRYERGERTATFDNLERGIAGWLEFPLAAPSVEGTLPLGVVTGLAAAEATGGSEIHFGLDGVVLVRLRLVGVLDEQGRDLPARLSLDGDRLRIDWRRSPAHALPADDGAVVRLAASLPDDLPLPDPAQAPAPQRARVELLLTGPGAAPESTGVSTLPAWTARGGQAASSFGSSVASAGDVNGDGFSDIVVGAWQFDNGQSNEGKAFVYHGGPGGVEFSPAWSAEGNQANASFGSSVAAAGDVNGDGFGDLLIGAQAYDNGQTDEGRVFAYLGSPTGLAAVDAWSAEPNQAAAAMGPAAAAGDVNGDGFDDVIVGAPTYDNGQTNEGRAWTYLGSASGLALVPAWSAEGNQTSALFGAAVAGAGDVDGDGYDDLIVGAHLYDSPTSDEGIVFLYRGGSLGPAFTSFWNAQGDSPGAQLGFSVAPAGDVNGDGYGDVVVGAPGYQGVGQARVHLGSSGGLSPSASWARGGEQSGERFGASVAGAGDLNGDGFGDVVVGANAFNNSIVDCGRAAAYLSRGGVVENAPSWRAEGSTSSAFFGVSVAGAGDVDGDGYSDLLVGASGATMMFGNEGAAALYRGSAVAPSLSPAWQAGGAQGGASLGVSVAAAGDVNGDGFGDVIVGAYLFDNGEPDEGQARVHLGSPAGLPAVPDWSAEGDEAGARFGYSAAGAGDVNGDGYGDVIVGAYFASNGEANEGVARIYPGSPSGVAAGPSWILEGNQPGAGFGIAVASAGDVNADGFADVLVGAHLYDNGETDEGAAFLFLGSLAGTAILPAWSVEGEQAGARAGFALGTAGDVNADGFSDVVVGAYLMDNGETDEGNAAIYRGNIDGLDADPSWSAEGNQAGANFGYAVGTAGDLDGDGYSDVAIGAIRMNLTGTDEGTVGIFYGGLGGPPSTPGNTLIGDQSSGWFGSAVATAGDVNGDGFGDLLVGARLRDRAFADEGRVSLYLGAPYGIDPVAAWQIDGDQASAYLGFAVAGAGDVNGDGFADLLVGALGFDATATNEGRASVFYGNGGDGLDRTPRQLRPDGAPLSPLAILSADLTLRLEARACGVAGPVVAQLEWELKPLGVPFDGVGKEQGTGTVVAGGPGAACATAPVTGLAQGLAPGYPYHWRLRTIAAGGGRPLSPWFSPAFNSPGETDLRAPGCADADGDGYVAYPTPGCPLGALADCFDLDERVYPGAPEECDGIATDCDAPAWPVIPADELDNDHDGFAPCDGDCDDASAASFPGNLEICDTRDNNCDGVINEGLAGLVDVCNGLDDNCDGTADEGNPGGGFPCATGQPGVCGPGTTACTNGNLFCNRITGPSPETCNNLDDDCNGFADGMSTVCGVGACQAIGSCLAGVDSCVPRAPAPAESCNQVDDDCDGSLPPNEQDFDRDGFPACNGDCDDFNAQRSPGLAEACDSIDNDCDGVVDSFEVVCGIGACATIGTCEAGVYNCDPSSFPRPEECNGVDDDCDGSLPQEELDLDGDAWLECAGDCDPTDGGTYPGAPETHDFGDNQCLGDEGSGSVDEISGLSGFFSPGDPTLFCWPLQPGASGYEATRSAAPDGALGCAALRTSFACWSDPATPPSGTAFYYLVRAVAPRTGSFGQDSLGSERRGECGGEGSCDDTLDGDGDGLVDCADRLDCFGVGGCTTATFTFTDTAADDIGVGALEAFFATVPTAHGDYIRLALTGGTGAAPFEWCSDRAVFQRTRYLTLAPWGGFAIDSGTPDAWHRTGSDPWIGPVADEFQNAYGIDCISSYAWCPQVGLGDRGIVIDPGHFGECEAWDFIYGCGGRVFTVTLTLGVDRASACGF